MFKIPKMGSSEYFSNILRKIIATALCCIVMQNIQIFWGSSHVRSVRFYKGI